MPRLCPLGRGYPGTGWSGRSAGEVQPGRVGISPEGSLRPESGHRIVGERCGKPHLLRGSVPSGLHDRTSLWDPYPKAFQMSFLQGLSRFGGRGLSGT